MIQSRDVFMLGAGYSRAVHAAMPTLKEVGTQLARRVTESPRYLAILSPQVRDLLVGGYLPGGNVESWLSSLAEQQPFLSESETAYNYGLFIDLSRELVGIVADPQQGFWAKSPGWSHKLIRLWHAGRTSVVTFNYDTIVEESVSSLDIPGSQGALSEAILGFLPRKALAFWGGADESPTFRLFKLHGSVDWYWNPADTTGDSLCRLPAGGNEQEARAALAGKVPFIVPPLATKGPFYSLGLVRELWQEARKAVEQADRVILLGYSLPLTDLTVLAMLSGAAPNHILWHVVNPENEQVAGRLMVLGVTEDKIVRHASAAQFVTQYERERCGTMTADLLAELKAHGVRDVAPIMVRQHRTDVALVTKINCEKDKLALEANHLDAHSPELRDGIPAGYPRRSTLVTELERFTRPRPITVRFDKSSDEYMVLAANDPKQVPGGLGVADWVVLEAQSHPTFAHTEEADSR